MKLFAKDDKHLDGRNSNDTRIDDGYAGRDYEASPINWTAEERKKLERKFLWKLDARMSILIVIYILNYIDRNNVPAARENGLVRDLGLTGTEYPSLLSLLYVGYILFQIPSNIIVEKTGRPSIYLPVCIIIWGLISTVFYRVENFGEAVAARFFLGIVEAAFFPGALFLLSKWYTKRELALRTAILYCGSLISNAFGPMIAAGVFGGGLNDALGIATWRWLFIIEGSITMFIGVISMFILPDFPHNSRGFSAEERKLAVLRMTEDAGESDSDGISTWKVFKNAMLDFRTHVMALTLTAMVVGLTFNQFFPTLTRTLNSEYSNVTTLLLAAPPFAFAALLAFANSWHSDRVGERYFHILWPMLMGIIGFIIALSTTQTAARYVSLFLMAGSYASFVVFLAWISNTFPRPPMQRAIAIAYINCFSQLGNIAGSYVFPSRWGPTYRKSFGLSLAMFVATMIGITFHRFTLQRYNRKIAELEQQSSGDEKILGGGRSGEIPAALNVVKGFRYML